MKKRVNWIFILLMVVAISACKKKNEKPNDPLPDTEIPGAVKTKHGEVVGTATQKIIGAAGGEVTVPNTTVKLVIPAGAIDGDVNFSVQEVSRTLADGAVGTTYRFLPENVTFKQDVQITMPYYSSSNMIPSRLRLAYQDKNGYWHKAKDAIVDYYKETVTVKTRHFSDWVAISDIYIKNTGKENLEKGESTELQVCFMPTKESPDNDDLLAPTVKIEDVKVKEWRFWGTSTLDRGKLVGGAAASNTYVAPAAAPKSLMRIYVEAVLFPLEPGKTETVLRFSDIVVLSEEYCIYQIGNSSSWAGDEKVDVWSGGGMYVNFYGSSGGARVHFEAPDENTGLKVFGEKVLITFNSGSQYFSSTYTACNSTEPLYEKGDIVVIGTKDGLVSGDAKGNLRPKTAGTAYCFGNAIPFSAKFRYRKK
ncbi:hypothetical protein [Pedobacter chitinilyticus]|uniref:ZU5 domain-containing protein n=1 Tax=Pedobacter chitinilyticus TaxID=2233776 RepID=A0A3S3SVY9_9SPHI|nr:hypothetical protein [Pedobacter chitinilyticus]RWU09857.1 hypothetical protein DPV69_00485 [Pedobacter chitinilyticus]